MTVPVVAIIGRPNVGKSALFNRLVKRRQSLVDSTPGLTRDRLYGDVIWQGVPFKVVDTGGFLPDIAVGLEAAVRRQAELALDACAVALFLCDAKTGATGLDGAIAKALRKRGVPSILVVNKADKIGDPVEAEFFRLGLGDPLPVSSEQGSGVGELLDRVVELLPPADEDTAHDPGVRVAIVGRPNVGKSSLVNALLREERMVVDAKPGTTVDAVDTEFTTPEGRFVLVDTAGLRHEAHFAEDAEFYATLRTLKALERADVVTVMLEADKGLGRQDARIISAAQEAAKPVLLAYNKWDQIEEKEARWKELDEQRESHFPQVKGLPTVTISAKVGTRLIKLPEMWLALHAENTKQISTRELNEWLARVQLEKAAPANRLGKPARIYYMTQSGQAPPRFVLFASQPDAVNASYHKFLIRRLRENFGFVGATVRLDVRLSE